MDRNIIGFGFDQNENSTIFKSAIEVINAPTRNGCISLNVISVSE